MQKTCTTSIKKQIYQMLKSYLAQNKRELPVPDSGKMSNNGPSIGSNLLAKFQLFRKGVPVTF